MRLVGLPSAVCSAPVKRRKDLRRDGTRERTTNGHEKAGVQQFGEFFMGVVNHRLKERKENDDPVGKCRVMPVVCQLIQLTTPYLE
jgi:hypothetical protein